MTINLEEKNRIEKPERQKNNLPGFVYFLSLFGGPWPLLPFLHLIPLKILRFAILISSPLPFLLVWFLPGNGLLIAILLGIWNLTWTGILFGNMPIERGHPGDAHPFHRLRRALALAFAALPFAVFLASMEQLLSDYLWSNYYPVNASISSISQELALVWINFGFVLFFSALHVSKKEQPWTLASLVSLILLVMGAHVFVNQLHLIGVIIPLWQVQELTLFPPWLDYTRQVLFLILWFGSVPVLVYKIHTLAHLKKKFIRIYLLGLLSIGLAMAGLANLTGLPINYAILMGQHFEKSGTPQKAIPWYTKALSWSRSDNLKSYLQFRVGLLQRKSGHLDEAKEAFIRVLIQYYHDQHLLLEAQEFRDKLEKNPSKDLKRVVIPGIEAKTEYKAAYCVPNSLGLILNFWGDRAGAKKIGSEITQLDKGSLITDEIYYSEMRGFSSLVLPLRSQQDIYKLIDAGIPVLAFIPGHVIAVFGYDQVLQTLVTYDVNTYDIWDDERWSEFSQDWSHMYNTIGIVVPKAKVPELKKILGDNIETQNEAYIQFLMANMADADFEKRIRHIGLASGHGFFFADWEYETLMNKRPLPMVPDSTISKFMMENDVYESQILAYLQSLYSRGDYAKAIQFIERYRKENRLSTAMTTLLSGCYYQMGDGEKASDLLLTTIDIEDQDPVTLEFLLKQSEVQNDAEYSRRISLKVLSSEEKVSGELAALAFWTWRKNTVIDFRNIDEALAVEEGYILKWNPYDKAGIQEMLTTFKLKKFRADDEFNQRNWEKKIRIYQNRLAVL